MLLDCFSNSRGGPIGIDVGDDNVKLVQLKMPGKALFNIGADKNNDKHINLIAGGIKNRPLEIKPGSADWQRWTIEALRQLTANGKFHGREVTAAIPADDVFIDNMKIPKTKNSQWTDAVLAKIKHKLPAPPDQMVIKYVPAEEDNVVVMATKREIIDRHLAIYENAQLSVKSLAVWPEALINSYTKFFGRLQSDVDVVVMLLDIEPTCAKVVICRHKNLLFAHCISIGADGLESEQAMEKLMQQLSSFRRQFSSLYRKAQIERVIFLSGLAVDRNICATIAKQMEMPAQMGDCLAAIETANTSEPGIERRECQCSWATAFGLGLS